MVDPKKLVIDYISDVVATYGSVPRERPGEFATVELTGERGNEWVSRPTVAIQAWSVSDEAAAQLSLRIREAMDSFAYQPHVRKSTLNARYRFDDPESGQSRYQLVYNLVVQD